MSLAGRRILVTRAARQASALADALRDLGAAPILVPTIEIVPPASFQALDAALARLGSYDWLVFTSANAVEAFHRRAQSLGMIPSQRKIAAIGPATRRAVNAIGLDVNLLPQQAVSESLAEALLPEAPGKSFLVVRAAEARDVLPEALVSAGATVTVAEAYRNQVPPGSTATLRAIFNDPAYYPDAITFTSASTVRNLSSLLEDSGLALPAGIVRASIGPITSQALRDLGLPAHIEAREPSIASLVSALAAHFNRAEG